jgi:homogentisate 1,2-dioxygenase
LVGRSEVRAGSGGPFPGAQGEFGRGQPDDEVADDEGAERGQADYHPLSIPVPYYHSNVDSDEVMFYCGGDYAARSGSGIGQGSISLHPGGHTHGPQPGATERSIGLEYLDELAVMVDTFRPLGLGEAALASDDGIYAYSWARGTGENQ